MDDIEEWLCADVVRLLYLDLFDLLSSSSSLAVSSSFIPSFSAEPLSPSDLLLPRTLFFPLFNSHISTNELTLSRDC